MGPNVGQSSWAQACRVGGKSPCPLRLNLPVCTLIAFQGQALHGGVTAKAPSCSSRVLPASGSAVLAGRVFGTGSAPSPGPPDRVLVPGVTFLFRRDVRTARTALLKAAAGPALRRGPSAASRSSGPLWPPARVRIGGDKSVGSRGRGMFSSAHCGLQSFVSCPTALFLLVSLPRPLSFPLAQGKRASPSKKAVSCSGSGMAVFFSSYTELLPF